MIAVIALILAIYSSIVCTVILLAAYRMLQMRRTAQMLLSGIVQSAPKQEHTADRWDYDDT